MNIKTRIGALLWADLRACELVAAVCAAVASEALLRIYILQIANISLYIKALGDVAPLIFWGVAFGVYAAARFATALGFCIKRGRCTIAVMGMALWASVFSAGTILQAAPSGMAILYCVPAMFEIWALAQALAKRRQNV